MRLLGWLRDRFWFVPTLFAIAAAALGVALPRLDGALQQARNLPFLFGGGPEGARALLSAIISSMITFTALVFSITIVVLQLTSSQFSPRVLRTFLRDRFNQVTLGAFVATFVYAMLVLRAVRGTADVSPFVPQLAVTTAFVLVLASVVLFLFYLHHMAQAIRVATIIAEIAGETRELLDRQHPAETDEKRSAPFLDGAAGRVVPAPRPGVVQAVGFADLADVAERSGVTVEGLRALGEFVPEGAALFRVSGGDVDDEQLHSTVVLGEERSMDQDVGFGLRQLVDIASRALSPGVNDPTTAVQVLDQLHDLLRRLATRPLPTRRTVERGGRVVLVAPATGFADYLDLGVDEIHHWGGDDPRILARLCVLLRDVHSVARPEHRPVIARKLASWNELPPTTVGLELGPSDVGLRSRSTTAEGPRR